MAIMLKKKDESVILDNNDEAFVGTEFASEPFSIEITKLRRSANIDILTMSVGEDGNISQGDYSREMFVRSITDIDGFVDENQQPLTVADGIAEIIWEYSPDVLVNAIKAKIQSFNAIEEKKSEPLEQDLVPTLPGQ